jgi:hypothetical protein
MKPTPMQAPSAPKPMIKPQARAIIDMEVLRKDL